MSRPDVFPDWDTDHRRMDPKHSFHNVPSPVVAIAAMVGDRPNVMVATSFSVGVSHEPPMCSFSVQNTSRTWQQLRGAPRLGITMLGTGHQEVLRQLASRNAEQRFDGVEWTRLPSGAVTFYDAPVWLECEIAQIIPVGDHEVIVVEVLASGVVVEHQPLIHHGRTFGTYTER